MIDGTSRLLFVAHTGDPTTPYENASTMSQLFKSPLITREGYMHTIVFSAESPCIDALVAQYLLQPEDALPSQICP